MRSAGELKEQFFKHPVAMAKAQPGSLVNGGVEDMQANRQWTAAGYSKLQWLYHHLSASHPQPC